VTGKGHNDIVDGKKHRREYYKRLRIFLTEIFENLPHLPTIEIENALFYEEDEEEEDFYETKEQELTEFNIRGKGVDVAKGILENK